MVTAARRPVVGRAPVARLAVGVAAQGARAPQAAMAFGEVNGQPAVLAWTGGLLQGTFVFDVAGERISAIRAILNPGKLAYLRRQLGTTAPAPIPWR